MEHEPTILVVDDTPANVELMEAVLGGRGYRVLAAGSGPEALDQVEREPPDLVLLDVVLPGMDGYEICRRLRNNPTTRLLPVVMITASEDRDRAKAIELGADDFLHKPINQAELLARVKSLLRIKEYQDTIQRQAAELAEWNRELEARVQHQVEELQQLGRLRRFLPPQVAELVVSSGQEAFLESHRREIAVVFCDLRGFTAFAESTEPEDMMRVLREYHESMGAVVFRFGGTVGRFAGDGLMIFFNDPLPCPEPAVFAVRMAVAMREQMDELIAVWRKHGYRLGFGVGITLGHATLGRLGFEGRFEYEPNGTVVNLAARLCEQAAPRQILVSERVYAAVEDLVDAEAIGELTLKGFARSVLAFNIVGQLDNTEQRDGWETGAGASASLVTG